MSKLKSVVSKIIYLLQILYNVFSALYNSLCVSKKKKGD